MRRFLSWLLALALPVQSLAAAVDSDVAGKMPLVDEYVLEASKAQSNMLAQVGQQEYLAKLVAAQIEKLEPEDFNLFLIYLADRYSKNPTERPALFNLTKAMTQDLAEDLANTAQINDGPRHFMVYGATRYAVFVLLAGVAGWRMILSSPARTSAFVTGFQKLEAQTAAKGNVARRVYQFGKRTTIGLAAAGTGTMLGYLEYVLRKNRAHRLNPAAILRVAQGDLACTLSLEGLDLQDRYNEVMNTQPFDVNKAKALNQSMQALHGEAGELVKQYPTLDNLIFDDPDFQADINALPVATNFQELRQHLSASTPAPNGQCYQMSLTQLRLSLESMQGNLSQMIPPPPTPEVKP